MVTIAALNRRLKGLSVAEVSTESIEATTKELLDAQRDQLLHGKRADGSVIGRYKNPAYARKKYAMNPLAGLGNWDLRLKGDYQNDLFVNVRDDSYVVGSADSKAQSIDKRVGDPLGLGGEYRQEYIDKLEPVFINKIKEIIKL
jgi:hypothetical protein